MRGSRRGGTFRVAISALALLVLAPTARAEPSAPPAQWLSLSTEIADPWPRLQHANGTYHDYLGGGYRLKRPVPYTRYGEALLGYALLQSGLGAGRRDMIDAGLRSIEWAVSRPKGFWPRPSPFEVMAVASAYNLALRELSQDPLFVPHRAEWERFLRTAKMTRLNLRRYGNHYLVEAVATLELLRSELRSTEPGTILAQRAKSRQIVERFINRRIPRVAAETTTRSRGAVASVLSDPPDQPIAYHGLSLGLYARAIELLGPRASEVARRTLRHVANASWWSTAPDGDTSYYGRSQSEAWSLSATSYGAEVTADLPGTRPVHAARYRALSERVLERLQDAHGRGPKGLYITPALGTDVALGTRALDCSAAAPSFTGLTLVLLNWSLSEMGPEPRTGPIGSDLPGATVVSTGRSRLGLLRGPGSWLAVRIGASSKRGYDLRYDAGLAALNAADGRKIAPLRPRTDKRQPDCNAAPAPHADRSRDSVGPVVERRGVTAFPLGSKLTARPTGVTLVARLRTSSGGALEHATRVSFKPLACGARVGFTTRAGDTTEYSVFLRAASARTHDARTIGDSEQVVRFSPGARVSLRGGYASGTEADLVRARIRWATPRSRPLRVSICSREGAAPRR